MAGRVWGLQQDEGIDFEPVVKIFTPDGNATWLLTELNPNDEYLAFGLCDLRSRGAGTRLREPARARCRPRLARSTPRVRSLLRADANDRGLRRFGPRVLAHYHLTCRHSAADLRVGALFAFRRFLSGGAQNRRPPAIESGGSESGGGTRSSPRGDRHRI